MNTVTLAGFACLGAMAALGPAAAQTPQIIAGAIPFAGLVQGPDGSIYGTTYAGGGSKNCLAATTSPYPYGCGTVFRIDSSGVASTLYKFSGKGTLARPGAIGFGSDGNLYGATDGNTGPGAYSLTLQGILTRVGALKAYPPHWASFLYLGGRFYLPDQLGSSIFSFGPANSLQYITSLGALGEFLIATGLTTGPDGALYGAGGTCIFRVPLKGKATNLYCGNSGSLTNQLAIDASGTIYGMTQGGGANGYGVFFSLTPDGTFTDLNDLSSLTGTAAANGLTFGNDGNLYGVAVDAGAFGNGSLVQATPAGTVTDLFDFGKEVISGGSFSYPSGATPSGALLKAQDGTFWGTTSSGGVLVTIPCGKGCKTYYNYGFGTVFHYDPVANKIITVVWFSGR